MVERSSKEHLDSKSQVTSERPALFYKYYEFDNSNKNYIEAVLVNSRIYYRSPLRQNDPFDSRIKYQVSGKVITKDMYIRKAINRQWPHLSGVKKKALRKKALYNKVFENDLLSKTNEYLNCMCMYCMTTLRDNILMWSHYADQYRGFCLGFDAHNVFFQKALPITYNSKLPKQNLYQKYDSNELAEMLLTKSVDWAYEKEWRIIEHYDTETCIEGKEISFPEESLKQVILGFRMRDENIKQIIEWCNKRKFKPDILLAQPKDSEYGLDIKPLEKSVD